MANYGQEYKRYKKYFQDITHTYREKPVVKTSIELVATLLTISFFVIFAIRPTVNTIGQLIAEINTQRQIQVKLDQKIQALQKAQNLWRENQSQISLLLDQALPKNPAPEKFIRQAEALAAQTGVNIQALSVDEALLFGQQRESQTEIQNFTATLTVEGGYPALTQFLNGMENLRRINNITSLEIGTTESLGGPGLSLKVSTVVPYH